MEGQKGGWLWAANHDGGQNHSVTVQVENRDLYGEVAITGIQVHDDELHSSIVYISQCVSDSGVENFDFFSAKNVITRRNVTSITFYIDVYNCWTKARWMINYWS